MNFAEPILIGRFFKNRKHDVISVKIKSYEGTIFVDIRQHYHNAAGVTCPTRKGIGLKLHRVQELVDLLEKAIARGRELGLLGQEPKP